MVKKTEGYEVTEDGKMYSLGSNWRGHGMRELRQDLNDDGYPSVRLTVDGKRTRYSVHVLVAEKFHGEKPNDSYEVRHLDGNKMNPHYSNLIWGTKQENADDRQQHGRTSRGQKHGLAIKAGLIKKFMKE